MLKVGWTKRSVSTIALGFGGHVASLLCPPYIESKNLMPETPSIIILGNIGRPYGVKGWMRLNSFTTPYDNILTYELMLEHQQQWQPLRMVDHEIRHPHIFIKLENCDTPEEAQRYTNNSVGILRDQLPDLADDEYYWADLEGLSVINQKGILLGKVDHLFSTGANDVIVVIGDKERLLPYIKDTVLSVDLQKKEIHVDWDENF